MSHKEYPQLHAFSLEKDHWIYISIRINRSKSEEVRLEFDCIAEEHAQERDKGKSVK